MADKKFTLQFDFEGNIGPIKTAVDGLKKSLSDIKIPDNIGTSLEKTLGRLTSELQVFEAATKDSFHDLSDIKTAEKSFNKIVTLLNQLNIQSKSVTGLDPKKFLPQETIDRVKKLEKNWESLQKEVGKQDQITKQIEQQTKAIKEQEAALKELEAKRNVLTDDIKGQKAQRKKLIQSRDEDAQSRNEIVAKMTELEGQKGGKTSAEYKLLNQELARLGQAIKNADKEIDALSAGIDRNATQQRKLKVQIEQANESFEKQKTELQNLQNLSLTPKGLTELRTELAELKEVKIDEIPTDLKELQTVINSLTEEELEEIATSLTKIKNAADDLPGSVVKGKEALEGMRDAGEGLQRTADEISNIKQRVLEFFSITNSIQLFKRAVQEAFNTVKELDAVMTETAVVTDFTVGDMWDKLPVYSKQATALGASIKDLYSATTLYYQQGLETNAAMGVGVETMKMARIANMDAADATQAMTAALRGFNMEVNELNAQKVNDVYSELAAITAADTSQIATAMSKTASIAASANMEFETTAALLSQIIETTQEAPETAGTAMKTIIARFTEVKQLFDEGQLKGQDTEGEEIDINKIDGALKSVGISLKDFLNGTKGIDDIFLELASKWDTLDLATQRYIATMAAGSRQQSRFIAMMSNYDRTMELVTAANNSAGASQEQFDKTLESLEAKLQKLSNAWDEFVMGLSNNEIIKLGVDLLTGLLETINNITSALSGGSGLVKSIVSLLTVVGALKGGKSLFDNLFGGKQLAEIDFGNGQKGVLKVGKDIRNQAEAEGQGLGKKIISGFQRSMEQGRAHGVTAGLKSFFGEVSTSYEEQVQQIDPKKVLSSRISEELESAKVGQGNFVEDKQGADLTGTINQLSELENGLNNGSISMEEAQKQAKVLGVDISNLDNNFETVQKPVENFSLNLQNIGVAAMGVGTAFSLLGGLAEKLDAEGLAKALKTIGAVLTTTGSAVTALSPILDKLGVSFGSFGMMIKGKVVMSLGALLPMIGGVAVALTALVGVFILLRNASPEYQLKQATEAANQTAEAADAAAESYNNLKASFESIAGKEDILEGLTTGTQEWKDAVAELNNEVLDLLTKYPQLSEFISSEGGVLTISEEGKQEVLDTQYQQKMNIQAANVAAQITKQEAQQSVDFQDLNNQLKLTKMVEGYDEYGNTTYTEVVDREGTEQLAKDLASGLIDGDDARLDFLDDVEGGFEEFLAYGRALNASEKTIEVFTDSLMTAAATNAEVSEEFKSQIGGMYDADSITKMTEKQEGDFGFINKSEKEEYAEAMGYTHKGGNKYEDAQGNEIKVTNAQVRSQLAAIKVQEELTNRVQTMANKMNELSDSSVALGKTFINLIGKANGEGFTQKDITDLQNADAFEDGKLKTKEDGSFASQAVQDLYNEVSDLYDVETFTRMLEEAYSSAVQMQADSQTKLNSMDFQEGIFANTNIDTGSLNQIVSSIYDVFLTSGRNVAQNLSISLDSILSEDPEQAQIFADALEMIDWSDKDQVEGFSETLLDLGFDATAAGVDVEALEQQIISAAKATRTFNLDNLREEIKSAEDLVKDLKDREDTERTFTKEERDLMVGADASLTGQFVVTGIDEFVYVGDSIGTLITALDANTAALLSEYGEQVTHNAEISDKWQNLADNGAMWTNGQNEYQVLSSIVQSGSLEGYNIEGVIGIMEKAGMGIDSGRSLGGYTPSQLAEIIMADYAQYGSNQARQENAAALNDYNTNLGQIAYQDQQKTDRQLLEDAQGSGQNQQYAANQIATEAASYSEVSDELAKYNELIDENGKLKDESQKAAYDAALKEMKFATEIAKVKKEMKDYGEEIDESLDSLEDIEEGTEDYKDALDDMAKQTNKYLDSDIDGAFLEQGDNLELLEKALEGDADAWEQFNRNVMNATAQAMANSKDMVTQFGIDANEVADITAAMDALEFDVNGTADVTQLVNEFLAAGGKAEEVAAYLEQLGLTNIDLEAEVAGVETIEDMIEGEGADRKVVGSIKATNVRLAPSSFSGFTGGGGRKSSGGGGGGGGGGSEPKKWENSYDEFYNTVEKLNEALRERERIERRYQKLLDNTNTKASDLVKNAREQLASLEEERKTREYLLKGRERQMADVEREYGDLGSYAWYNEEKQVIEINWTKIEALDGSTNEELTSRIEEYIDKLEEQQDLIEEEQDSIAEIEDAVKEIREQGKDEYFDLESQIKEALEKARQEEIDRLSEINDSINDTNSRLIDAMQSSIDKYRQDRENERTEEELSDKQRRLAYLQQDTSGANALEILQLQEEIAQGQEDYTDTLIDQKISELQKQNDEAAEQRQQQIDLMQAQLDHYLDSELVWADIYGLMNSGIGPDGIIAGSALEQLLMEGASFEAMSYLEKMKWLEELENNVAKAVQWLMEGNSTEALMAIGDLSKGQKIEFTTADGKKVNGTLDEAGNVITDSGEKYEGVYRTYNGAFVTQENYIKPEPPKPVEPEPEPEQPAFTPPQLTDDIKRGVSAAIINGNYGWGVGGARSTRLAEVFGVNDIQRNYVNRWITSGYSGSLSDYSYINMRKKFKQYKTGGLADFTGPAWLDGTKSKPEYILNAEQTKSFFQLVDVLGSLKSGATQSSQITGDNIYDVDINVESIGNDYDVEQLASTIKRMINDDARYRNNNAINLQR